MERTFINPQAAAKSIPRGYSHAIKVTNPGSLLFVAGQGAIDENLEIVGHGNIEVQTRKTFENIKRNLEAANASFSDVVRMVVYCSDIESQQWPIRNVRSEFIDVNNPPVSTMIEISKFAVKGMMIEIEVMAAIP